MHVLIYTIVEYFKSEKISGDYTEGATPVPISNTVVKPFKVDGTCLARDRESRTVPDLI